MKKKLKFVSILTVMLMTGMLAEEPVSMSDTPVSASTRTLSTGQQKNADRIAKVTAEHYNEYGVLPSVAVAQAFIESTLGDRCRGYNLWGINSGKGYNYSSLDEGNHGVSISDSRYWIL